MTQLSKLIIQNPPFHAHLPPFSGTPGTDGLAGRRGYDGRPGVNGRDGMKGVNGRPGTEQPGRLGEPGDQGNFFFFF